MISGDCLEVMRGMEANSVSAIVCDPPYGLAFMGKAWDAGLPHADIWAEALRICKPGAFLLAFGGTRTYHRLAWAIEDAGWEIRDCLMWIYGSGFPKSLNIGKAIDKAQGCEREVIGISQDGCHNVEGNIHKEKEYGLAKSRSSEFNLTAHSSDLAKQFDGYGTALKPAYEPILMCMKPCEGTFAQNAERWGHAGINIDASRIGHNGGTQKGTFPKQDSNGIYGNGINGSCEIKSINKGRWPSNLLLDEEAAELLGEPSRFFYVAKASTSERNRGLDCYVTVKHTRDKGETQCLEENTVAVELLKKVTSELTRYLNIDAYGEDITVQFHRDFSFTIKTKINQIIESKILNSLMLLLTNEFTQDVNLLMETGGSHVAIVQDLKKWILTTTNGKTELALGASNAALTTLLSISDEGNWKNGSCSHPTVKPIRLMEYLIRLIAPPKDAVILDPFAGSGTTLLACQNLGLTCIGIEKSSEYCAIAQARIDANANLFSKTR